MPRHHPRDKCHIRLMDRTPGATYVQGRWRPQIRTRRQGRLSRSARSLLRPAARLLIFRSSREMTGTCSPSRSTPTRRLTCASEADDDERAVGRDRPQAQLQRVAYLGDRVAMHRARPVDKEHDLGRRWRRVEGRDESDGNRPIVTVVFGPRAWRAQRRRLDCQDEVAVEGRPRLPLRTTRDHARARQKGRHRFQMIASPCIVA
jgi:hypothetical protein